MEAAYPIGSASPPQGDEDARVDEKGRLKLPAKFFEYLQRIKENEIFVTTLNPNSRTSVLYPISTWLRKQQEMDEIARRSPEDAEAVGYVRRVAGRFGANIVLDGSGRFVIPQRLREAMGLVDTKVWLAHEMGRFNLWTDADYEADFQQAMGQIDPAYKRLKGTGLF